MRSARVAVVLIDGIGDVSFSMPNTTETPSTPMQRAKLPNMDELAGSGLTGLMDPVAPGLACGSDTAHLSILGYSPAQHYRGRGAFETMGAGLDMKAGDIAFKSNFATLDLESGMVVSRRADRNFHQWGIPLCDLLNGIKLPSFPDVEVAVKYATEHRCGVRLRGPGLSDCITGTDPLKDNLALRVCKPKDGTPEAKRTSDVVNEMSKVFTERLREHPLNAERRAKGLPEANVVLFRGAGARIAMPSFEEKHGMRAFMIAPTAIIGGLGKCLEMDRFVPAGTTGDYHTDLGAKARSLLYNLSGLEAKYDFGFLHVKAVDDAGHDRNVALKIRFLEECDRMIGQIVQALRQDTTLEYILVVTGDHSTPVLYGDHSCEPVPFLIAPIHTKCSTPSPTPGSSASVLLSSVSLSSSSSSSSSCVCLSCLGGLDPVKSFDELSVSHGLLGRFPGDEVMPLIKRFARIPILGQQQAGKLQADAMGTSTSTSTATNIDRVDRAHADFEPVARARSAL